MIFGLEQPQIKVGETTIELLHTNMQPDFMIPILFENVSPLNGERKVIYKGDYARFSLDVNLFENDNPDLLFEQLKNLQQQLVVFYPHVDGEAVKDRAGNDVLFFISSVVPYYLDNESAYDMVKIVFNSVGFVDYKGEWNILGFGYQFGINFGWGL